MAFQRSRKFTTGIVIFLLLLIGLRVYLPVAVQNYVNRTLDRLPDYDGEIGDVDLYLIRGAYNIQDVRIVKTSGAVPVPFFESKNTDFSVQWKALFKGKVVGEVHVEEAKLNFVTGPTSDTSQTSIDSEWLQVVKDLFPLRINRFSVKDSEIHYRDFHSEPRVNVVLSNVSAEGTNFSNTRSPTAAEYAVIKAEAKAEKQAPLKVSAKLLPAAKKPEFNLDMSLRDFNIVKLNDFLKAYAGFDAEAGEIGFDIEMATANDAFKGFVKPIIKDLEVFRLETDSKNPLFLAWEGFIGLFAELFENQRHAQLATAINYEGTLNKPDMNLWSTIGAVLRNAFIQALEEGNEDKVDIADLTPEGETKEIEQEED